MVNFGGRCAKSMLKKFLSANASEIKEVMKNANKKIDKNFSLFLLIFLLPAVASNELQNEKQK